MTDFEQTRQALAQARRKRDDSETQLLADKERLRQLRRAIAKARRGDAASPSPLDDLEKQRQSLEAAIRSQQETLHADRKRSDDLFAELLKGSSPQQQIEELNDSTPFLLFPVRLETRFAKNPQGGGELWVRVFPDEVSVDTHEEALTETEILSGRSYWETVWRSAGTREAALSVWRVLVASHGAPRAAWIARVMEPQNTIPSEPVPDGTPLDPAPQFPSPPTAEHSWSRAPRAVALPDRFVFVTFVGDVIAHEIVGAAIPDPLIVGPDPQGPSDTFEQQDSELEVDPAMRWMVDFDEAVRVGMAARMPLSAGEMQAGIDRLIVLGTRVSSSAKDSQRTLEALLQSHHFSSGLSFLPIGTPTNSSDDGHDDDSQETADVAESSFSVEREAPVFVPTPDPGAATDGQRLAESLGIDAQVFQHTEGAGAEDANEALAMNRALWPATLGYFLDEMMRPVFDLETIRRVQNFQGQHLFARGALPTLQVGNQPYGVIPTSVLSRFRFAANDSFHSELLQTLRTLHSSWWSLRDQVARMGASSDPQADLLRVLGGRATSTEFFSRMTLGSQLLWNWAAFRGHGETVGEWNQRRQQQAQDLLQRLGVVFEETPRIFDLSFFRSHTTWSGTVIDDLPPSETRLLSLADEDGRNYIEWLLGQTVAALREQDFGNDVEGKRPVPTALLYRLLRQSMLLSLWDASMRIQVREGLIVENARLEVELLNMGEELQSTRWDFLEAKVTVISPDIAIGDVLSAGDAGNIDEVKQLEEHKAALSRLAGVPTARLERLFAEHLDLVSYRVDAWELGLVHRRLVAQRQQTTGADRQGIYLGAYGWLEDLRPGATPLVVPDQELPEELRKDDAPVFDATDPGGFVHAPSMNQAVACAVLRSGYLSHGQDADDNPLALNLSSERLRRALGYLDGVRQGQPLGALLGYRFERGLSESQSAAAHLPAFRNAFPLVAGRATPPPPDSPEESADELQARHIVDGLRLVQTAREQDYPYGVDNLPAKGSSDGRAIQREVSRLLDDLDAIGDLALAEGVLQATKGNYDRAGGVLRALSQGGHPPEFEFPKTPRTGTPLTQRVLVAFDESSTDTSWPSPTTSPRAQAEPRVNRWLAAFLGDPGAIFARVVYVIDDNEIATEVTAEELDIQPLDFLFLSPSKVAWNRELMARIAYRVHARDSVSATVNLDIRLHERAPGWADDVRTFGEMQPLVDDLRETVQKARPLRADDLILPTDLVEQTTDRSRHDTDELTSRVQSARDTLATTQATLQSARATVAQSPAPMNAAAAQQLRDQLVASGQFAVTDATPHSAIELDEDVRASLLEAATRVQTELASRLSSADTELSQAASAQEVDTRVEHLRAAATTLFGGSFPLSPLFSLHSPSEWQVAFAARGQLLQDAPPDAVEDWLVGVSCVRTALDALERARLVSETLGQNQVRPEPVQLPFVDGEKWLALPFEAADRPSGDHVSFVVLSTPQYAGSPVQAGLFVDEWVEVLPNQEEVTGLAVHVDRPKSEPPQALLLAVTPEETGKWQWQDLLDTVRETLDLTRVRAVEPDLVDRTPYAQLLPAVTLPITPLQATIAVDFNQS